MEMTLGKILQNSTLSSFSGEGYRIRFQTQNAELVRASQAIQELRQLKLASRRGVMVYLTASLLTALGPVDAVEARIMKAENTRKVKEKLNKLREEARVSKSKAELGSDGLEKKSEVPHNRPQ